MADIDLFDNWFRVADKDRDGVISGMEAVEFFQRSQLPQGTLFKVIAETIFPMPAFAGQAAAKSAGWYETMACRCGI